MNNITLSKQVMTQELDGETVLLDLASESFFGLDEISTRVWQLLQTGGDRAGVIDTLLEEYDVGREVLEKDVGDLLTRLADAGLITLG